GSSAPGYQRCAFSNFTFAMDSSTPSPAGTCRTIRCEGWLLDSANERLSSAPQHVPKSDERSRDQRLRRGRDALKAGGCGPDHREEREEPDEAQGHVDL